MLNLARPSMRAAVIATACVVEAAALVSLVHRAGTAPLAPDATPARDANNDDEHETQRNAARLASVREVIFTSRAS